MGVVVNIEQIRKKRESKMTIDAAVQLLREKYEINKNRPEIENPLAYSLLQVWVIADTKERR